MSFDAAHRREGPARSTFALVLHWCNNSEILPVPCSRDSAKDFLNVLACQGSLGGRAVLLSSDVEVTEELSLTHVRVLVDALGPLLSDGVVGSNLSHISSKDVSAVTL